MSKDELLKLADRYQEKADTAADNYQESGISRYRSAARRNEDLADAFRMAADAADEHQAYIAMKGQMCDFACRARMASTAETIEKRDELLGALARDLVSYGRLFGLIGG